MNKIHVSEKVSERAALDQRGALPLRTPPANRLAGPPCWVFVPRAIGSVCSCRPLELDSVHNLFFCRD